MKYNGPKVKLSRRLGLALTAKAERCIARRAEKGGKKKRPAKLTDYGRQLLEKQKLRFQYNVAERQLRNYFLKAARKTGNTADNLINALECRLDALVLRAGFSKTIYQSRQLVGHGHILVNGRKVNIPSYQVRPGSKISVREKSRKIPLVVEALENANPPPYVILDKEAVSAEFVATPARDAIPIVCDVPVVVEFYSR